MARRGAYVFASKAKPRRAGRVVVWLLLILLAVPMLVFGSGLLVSRSVHLEKQYVTISELPEEFRGFRILHLSDLHGATYGDRQAAVGSVLRDVSYGCVIMTGDMLGPNGEYEPLRQLVDRLNIPAGLPVYYYPGDEDTAYLDSVGHGTASPYSAWAELITARGVEILDRPKLITRGRNDRARLWFIPDSVLTMDIPSHVSTWTARQRTMELSGGQDAGLRVADYELRRAADIQAAIEDMRDGDIFIVVSHTPLTAQTVSMRNEGTTRANLFATRHASLVIAGHLCGGQFRLPGLGAVFVPDFGTFPPDEQITGLGWDAGLQQYISPGLGASSVYPWWASFRFFNPPVVTQLILTNEIV